MTPFACQARWLAHRDEACTRGPDTRTRAFCTATALADPLTGLPNRAELLGALHAAVRTLDQALLQRAFTGLETRDGKLWLKPCLPDDLHRLAFRLHYREHHGVEITVTHDRLVIAGRHRVQAPLGLRVDGQDYQVDPGGTCVVALHRT